VRCVAADRAEFEAYLGTSIVFARSALHRLQTKYGKRPGWTEWWDGLLSNAAVEFFRKHRNTVLKEARLPIGQIVYQGGHAQDLASIFYYFEDGVPATVTVGRHLGTLEGIVRDAIEKFS
jgi:hypothetical protein